jgi:hypothetical protein
MNEPQQPGLPRRLALAVSKPRLVDISAGADSFPARRRRYGDTDLGDNRRTRWLRHHMRSGAAADTPGDDRECDHCDGSKRSAQAECPNSFTTCFRDLGARSVPHDLPWPAARRRGAYAAALECDHADNHLN